MRMLRQVREIPHSDHDPTVEPFVARDIREFVRTGMDKGEISYEDRDPGNTRKAAERYLKRHGLWSKVGVVQRKMDGVLHIYLVRIGEIR